VPGETHLNALLSLMKQMLECEKAAIKKTEGEIESGR
jgi:hypothetical protein